MKILKIRNRYNANVKMIRMEMKKLYFEYGLIISYSLLNPIVFKKKKEREKEREDVRHSVERRGRRGRKKES